MIKHSSLKTQTVMRKVLFLCFKIILSVVILVYIFSIIPIPKIINSFRSANIFYILLVLIIIPLMQYLASVQMKIMTDKQGMSLSVWDIFRINFITNFYGLFLPGYLSGSAIRWYKFSKPDGKRAEAFAAIIYGRLNDTIILVLLGLVFWKFDPVYQDNRLIGYTFNVLLFLLLLIYFGMFNRNICTYIREKVQRVNFIPEFLKNKLTKIIISVSHLHDLSISSRLNILFLLTLRHLLGILTFFLLALSLNLNITIINMAWIRTIILIILLLPISLSGLGIREGSLIFLLEAYGVTPINAVAFSLLLFGRGIFEALIGGLYEFRYWFFKRSLKPVNERNFN